MRNYRVSGYLDGEPTQVDVVAENKDHAKSIAMAHYDFEEVVNVSELQQFLLHTTDTAIFSADFETQNLIKR